MSRIVELRDQRPLLVRQADVPAGGIRICRCGLAATWPLCDDSHKATRSEDPSRVYRYVREVPEGTLSRVELPMAEEQRPNRQGLPDDSLELI